MRSLDDLRQLQALPLSLKVALTKDRIRQWVHEFGTDGVYVSFSGGKDSTVLLHIVRSLYADVPAVFCDTGLEYPEIREFIRRFDNVTWLKPRLNFRQIIERYGYPFISKEISGIIGGGQRAMKKLELDGIDITNRNLVVNECAKRINKEKGEWRRLAQCLNAVSKTNEIKPELDSDEIGMYSTIPQKYTFLMQAPFFISSRCCNEMKKNPVHNYAKETGRLPITAQMADESRLRKVNWLKNGCNMFNTKNPISNPMSFWTEQDVLQYIKQNHIQICSVYGKIVETGEIEGQMNLQDCFENVSYSAHLETTGMKRTGCMFCGYGCQFEESGKGRFELMKQTHPKQYEWIMKDWDEGGLGYKKVIDWMNEHGNLNIRY